MNKKQARIEALETAIEVLSSYQKDGSLENENCNLGHLADERALIQQEYEGIVVSLKKRQQRLLSNAGFPEDDEEVML